MSLASFLRWQKLAAQHVLPVSTGSHNVPNAHITKADRIWWAVGMKISSGCCNQELYDWIHGRFLQFRSRDLRGTHRLRFPARDWSSAAGCENECGKQDCEISHGQFGVSLIC